MQIHWIDVAVLGVYLAGIAVLGVYQAVKIRTTGDYFVGSRRFGKFYTVMHALGAATHADEPVSVAGAAFKHGLSGIWYTYIYLLINPFFWLIAPFVRRTRFLTIADFFRVRYGPSLAIMYAIMGVVTLIVSMGMVLKGTGAIALAMTGSTAAEFWAILVMTIVFVTYGFAGGLIASVITDSVQGVLVVVMSLLVVPFGLVAVGGFRGMHEALGEEMFSLTASRAAEAGGIELTIWWVLATSLTALIGLVAQPGLMSLLSSGKTELEARMGYTYGTIIKRFCAMGWVFTGLIMAALVAQGKTDGAPMLEHRENTFGIAVRDLLPVGLTGLMAASILAAQMSTLSGQMVNSSALASHNLYRSLINPGATDRQVLVIGRLFGIVAVVFGVLLGLAFTSVAQALTTLIQVQSLTGIIIWAGVLWRRATTAGAWAGFVVATLLWLAFGPAGGVINAQLLRAGVDAVHLPLSLGAYGKPAMLPYLLLIYVPAGVLVMMAVSLLTKPQPRKQLDDFFLLLKTPVGQEQNLIDAGVPIIYTGNTTPNELETKHPKLVHWGGALLAALICALILGLLKLIASIGA